METIRAVVFDLYGTLIRIHTDEEDLERVWKPMIFYYGYHGAQYDGPDQLRRAYRTEVRRRQRATDARFGSGCGEVALEQVLEALFRKKGAPWVTGEMVRGAGMLLRACANGSSELMTNLSSSVVNTLYNLQLMELAGEDGVAAYGVLMYINFIFNAIFFGYAIGSAPVISYHYGAGNSGELRSLFRKSLTITALCALVLTALAEVLSHPLSVLFVGYDPALAEMTYHGFRIYALAFLFCGFNIFGSAFFTALGNGGVSAAISFLRTLVFQVAAILLLPFLLGLDGVWLAIVAAELCALAVTVTFFLLCRRRYQYA